MPRKTGKPVVSMTRSREDYLECVYRLSSGEAPVRVRDIAEALGVKRPSVVHGIQQLEALGYVEHAPYQAIVLTGAGRAKAEAILSRHTMLTRFLERLGVSDDLAEADACKMEHILSSETLDAVRRFLDRET